MALVQSSKNAGTIRIEAASPGLTSASVSIAARAVKLRPQVAVWEREVPSGSGITGLWRPAQSGSSNDFISMIVGTNTVFTIHQDGNKLTGTVEGGAGFFGGDDVPTPIVEGSVNGDKADFKSGDSAYIGTIKGSRLELQRSFNLPWESHAPPKPDPGRPAMSPAPDGSDPSIDTTWEVPSSIPVVLHRVER